MAGERAQYPSVLLFTRLWTDEITRDSENFHGSWWSSFSLCHTEALCSCRIFFFFFKFCFQPYAAPSPWVLIELLVCADSSGSGNRLPQMPDFYQRKKKKPSYNLEIDFIESRNLCFISLPALPAPCAQGDIQTTCERSKSWPAGPRWMESSGIPAPAILCTALWFRLGVVLNSAPFSTCVSLAIR